MELKLSLVPGSSINFDLLKWEFSDFSIEEYVRYLKGIHTNKARFQERWHKNYTKQFDNCRELKVQTEEHLKIYAQFKELGYKFLDECLEMYDRVEPFSYKEAFEIKSEQFRALVFSSINIVEMIDNLGKEKIAVQGTPVTRRTYSETGERLKDVEYHNIYETYKVDCTKLGTQDAYAVRCWCTSTNKEHWIWIEDQYKDDPLSAIASTFRLPKNVLENADCLKRQGDIMLIEMKPGFEDLEPSEEVVTLSKEQYFGLLVAES